MKPYHFRNLQERELIFNYRLSRARQIIESSFGIWASGFRVFHRPIIAKVDKVIAITKAVVALHNFLMNVKGTDGTNHYCPETFIDQEGPNCLRPRKWRQDINNKNGIVSIRDLRASNNYGEDAKWVQDQFKHYFSNKGAVKLQQDTVQKAK